MAHVADVGSLPGGPATIGAKSGIPMLCTFPKAEKPQIGITNWGKSTGNRCYMMLYGDFTKLYGDFTKLE